MDLDILRAIEKDIMLNELESFLTIETHKTENRYCQCLDIEKDLEDSWPENSLKSAFNNELSTTYFCMAHGEVVAYAVTHTSDTQSDLYRISVRANFQRCGVGSFLLDWIKNDCRQHKIEELWLEVRKSNKRAVELYEKMGFSFVSERKEYYSDPKEDALIYRVECALLQ